MQHKLYLFLAAVIFTAMNGANAQYYYQLSTGNSVSTYEDENGLVGIGTTSPAALLQITQPLTTSPGNYFQITATALIPPSTVVEETILKVDASGNVGIGTATPGAPLQIRGKLWYNEVSDFGGAPLQVFTDPAERIVGGFFNAGDETGNPGGSFLVVGNPNNEFPALGVWDPTNEVIPFAVLSNSTIGMGVDVSSSSNFNPEAQVTITKNNDYGHMFKVQSTDQSQNYFDVDNNGHVGIGIEAGTTDGALTVYENGSDTHLDILGTYQHSAIRFFEYSTTHPTHSIGNSDGVLLIDPGLADGLGIDKLKVDGDVDITKNLGVGMSVPNSLYTTVGVKGSDYTFLDLFENNDIAGLRWINPSNHVKHLIREDGGDLLIDPGIASGGGNDKLKIDAGTYINGQTGIGIDVQSGSTLALKGASSTTLDIYESASSGWDGQLRFKNSSGDTRHLITDDLDNNNLLIKAGVGGSAVAKIKVEGDVQIGSVKPTSSTYVNSTSSENNLSVNGWVVSKKVIVETSNWADKVFATDYNLKSLSEIEQYITANKHLPEIPNECEVLEKGVDVGEMNKLLLQKVEELTLYVIAQQKQIDALVKK